MTIEEQTNLAYCWGQNHGGIKMTEVPDFVKKTKNRIIKEAFIHGLYWCQDAGPVTIFESKNVNFVVELQSLLYGIDIATHQYQNLNYIALCPNSWRDDYKLAAIVTGETKQTRFN